MDASTIIQNIQEIIFAVDSEYVVKYVSPQISRITGKPYTKILGGTCYKDIVGRSKPCQSCPIPGTERTIIFHDLISHDGERCFYSASVSLNDGVYLECLTDITEIRKENDACRHQIKELRASQITSQLQKNEIKSHYDFLNNVINSLGYGLMVADTEYNIVMINSLLRSQAGLEPNTKQYHCYNVYGRQEPCADCHFANKRVTKSPRVMGNRNMTIMFESFNGFVVESVRDATRELQLINEIRSSQDEIQEKQRQMALLNTDLLRMNDKLKEAQNLINDELRQVGAIQQSLLPESLPDIPGYEFGAFYTPAEHAGGDYYDCIEMNNNFWGFTIADVSGHGTPAAVIMAMARAIMRSYTYDVVSSSEALAMVNEILCDNVHTRDFVTMFYMVLDSVNARLNFASAGHNPVLHFDKSEMLVRSATASGLFLAAFPNVEYEEKTLALDDGDILFMYTDGLVEAMNSKREQYGMDRVISRIVMYHNTPCDTIINEIMTDVRSFTENCPFDDDVTILVIKKLNKQ